MGYAVEKLAIVCIVSVLKVKAKPGPPDLPYSPNQSTSYSLLTMV